MQVGSKFIYPVIAYILCAILLLPFASLLFSWVVVDKGALEHIASTRLFSMVVGSLVLTVGAVLLSLIIGVCAAWCSAVIEFPGRSVLSKLLVMPLAVPAYILAMLYGQWLDVAGPLQSLLRMWGVIEQPLGSFRSLIGAIIVMALALYPYVYVLARNALQALSPAFYESAYMLGVGRMHIWRRVVLPAIRPAMAAGAALVAMESLAEYGVVSLYNVDTLTRGIYRSWFGLYDIVSAVKLASLLVLFVIVSLAIEKRSRIHMRYSHATNGGFRRWKVSKKAQIAAFVICVLPVLFGFILPVLQLVQWAIKSNDFAVYDVLASSWHSISLACITALLCSVIALFFAYVQRYRKSGLLTQAMRLSVLGYAVPGAVVAVALFMPIVHADKWLAEQFSYWFDRPVSLVFTGTVAALVLAYVIRFLALSYNSIHSALQHVYTRYDESSALLGVRGYYLWRHIHWPLIRPACIIGALIVFADTIKELPASLMLRPFNYNTLAVQAYEYASDSRIVEAGLPALVMVLLSMVAMLYMLRVSEKRVS